MSGKAKSGKKSSKGSDASTGRKRNGPEELSGGSRFESYDEQRTSLDPTHESDYDVDENDIHSRSEEYKDDGGNTAG
jgi:hypothetical protein